MIIRAKRQWLFVIDFLSESWISWGKSKTLQLSWVKVRR